MCEGARSRTTFKPNSVDHNLYWNSFKHSSGGSRFFFFLSRVRVVWQKYLKTARWYANGGWGRAPLPTQIHHWKLGLMSLYCGEDDCHALLKSDWNRQLCIVRLLWVATGQHKRGGVYSTLNGIAEKKRFD